MEDIVAQYTVRYEKALKVIKKYKNQYQFEVEISKELARRNDELLKQQQEQAEKLATLHSNLEQLATLVLRESDEEAKVFARTVLPNSRVSPTKSVGPKSRRQSAICIALPELSGTSLVRKNADGEFESTGGSKTSDNVVMENDVVHESLANVDEKRDILEIKVADENVGPPKMAPLFEHFIVVGAAPEAATGLALKSRQFEEDKSYSAFLMKRLGGMLGSAASTSRHSLPRVSNTVNSISSNGTDETQLPAQQVEPLGTVKEVEGIASAPPTTAGRPSFFASGSTKTFGDLTSSPSTVTSDNGSSSSSSFSLLRVSSTSILSRFTPFTNSTNQPQPAVREQRSSSTANDPTPNSGEAVNHVAVELNENIISPAAPPTTTTIISAPTSSSVEALDYSEADASMLYRYPLSVEPPPAEVCDFCLPFGGRLQRLNVKDQATVVQDMLYGQAHSKRSARCFLFMLEDKTIVTDTAVLDEEAGIGTGRLYGICVVHPRLVTAVVAGSGTSNDNTAGTVNVVKHQYDYESLVCYAFITRYPLFDFFFQAIFDMITAERLHRMEQIAMGTEVVGTGDNTRPGSTVLGLNSYQYLPSQLLTEILDKLTKILPPRYNDSITFNSMPTMAPIVFQRPKPKDNGILEHMLASSEWALPTLLAWIPVETLVWTIGLLLCEAKIIVVGSEPGIVSCGVLGLLSLIRPLIWLAPLIPMLPLKHIDFVESPVPIVAGLVFDVHDTSSAKYSAQELLKRCNDADNGTVSAVLDLNERELYTSGCNEDILGEILLPGGEALIDRLSECMQSSKSPAKASSVIPPSPSRFGHTSAVHSKTRPLYAVSQQLKEESRAAQELVERHILTLIEMGKMVEEKVKRCKAAEIARNLNCQSDTNFDSVGTPVEKASQTREQYVIGVNGLESCEAEVDLYEHSDEGAASTGEDQSNLHDDLLVSPGGKLPSNPSSSSWVSGLSSLAKSWGSVTLAQPQLNSPPESGALIQFSDEEDDELSDKEELKELGDYYSSFVAHDTKAVDNTLDAKLSANVDPIDAAQDVDISPNKSQSLTNRSIGLLPALSSSNSLRGVGLSVGKEVLTATPSRSSSSGVGGFFSGLLGGGASASTMPASAGEPAVSAPIPAIVLANEKLNRHNPDGVIALSKEPMNCDADSFMRRFIITQMFAEMFGEAVDPCSFDVDTEVDVGDGGMSPFSSPECDRGLGEESQSPATADISDTAPLDHDSSVRISSPSPLSSSQNFTGILGTIASTANRSLNIRPVAKSLSIQTSAGLGLAVDNLGLGGIRRPHSMRASIAAIGPLATSISTSSSNLLSKFSKNRSKSAIIVGDATLDLQNDFMDSAGDSIEGVQSSARAESDNPFCSS